METTVVAAGGGPAGIMLGLLLARAGIDVVVLEKHADFLRDFRGDTIHPSTLELIDQLGLTERFEQIPHGKVHDFAMGEVKLGSLTALGLKHPYIAIAPQWDFLTMLAEEGRRFPSFKLIMNAEVTEPIRDAGRIAGVRYRDPDGRVHEVRAALTVATDGRHSRIRAASGLEVKETGSAFDTLWFRLPKEDVDTTELYFRVGPGRWIVGFDRRTYVQVAYMIPKGGFAAVERAGVEEIREGTAAVVPELAGRVRHLRSMDDVTMLEVRVNRAARWHLPGLLLIGDAAHAMSPMGGVGVKLALDDAVATANLLAEPLLGVQRDGTELPDKLLAAVQRRRELPTVVTQKLQQAAYSRIVEPAFRNETPTMPLALRTIRHVPALRHQILRVISLGVRQEHIRTPSVLGERAG
ncbi:FAD-dependent oxidoreductase [Nonomuraea sp. FMUSA5-5]|uniref:FAD-dependent oxidoreductase n=1 Tax=Nonomuraea composti TaxID=2720023 RepID=A0ABX1BG17_9ACTN|nr:FAD-dependent oxidoreductase [Nonomuraea sp. FMUSA5-5]NJP96698.1 FAD-dependent oxidoreductase [Nonomuraea sp. FMUSA5-5]